MRCVMLILLLSSPLKAWAGESAPWMGRPVQDIEDIQGPPDTIIPAWVCQQRDEFNATYGYHYGQFLEGTVYSKASICSVGADGQYYDIYIYTQPAIHQMRQRLDAHFHIAVNEKRRVVSYGAGFSPPCNVSFEQWMQGDVDAGCFLYTEMKPYRFVKK